MITERDDVMIGAGGRADPVFGGPMSRARGEAWIQRYQSRGRRGPCVYELIAVPYCEVCGESARFPINYNSIDEMSDSVDTAEAVNPRCLKHIRRNPCAIEGCTRSTKATHGYSRDDWFCGEHWRAFVPPGSPERRVYNRIWQRARRRKRRFGEEAMWGEGADRAFWRVWRSIVSRARARARGDVDMDEVKRLMGWD